MKNKTYHTVGTIPKLNIEIVESGKTDNPKTQIHGRSFHCSRWKQGLQLPR